MLAGFFVFHVSGRETHVMNFTDNSYAKLTKFICKANQIHYNLIGY